MGQCPALAYPMAARPNSTTVAPVQMRNAHPPASLPTSGPMVWEQQCARGERSWTRAVWPVARWGALSPGRSLGRGTRAGQGTGRMNDECRRLAKPGRGGDERQFAVQPCIQPLNQARARDEFRPDGGDIEFGGQQWGGRFALLAAPLHVAHVPTQTLQEGVNATASTRGGELGAHAGRLTLVTEERDEGKPSPAAGKLITRSSKDLISPSV